MDAIPSLISYIDTDLRYSFCNRAYSRWFHKPMDEIVGHSVENVLGAEAFANLRPFMVRALAGETVKYDGEVNYATGGKRWIEAEYIPDFDEDGHVAGFVVSVSDLTERKRTEDALANTKSQLEAAFQASLDGVMAFDTSGQAVLVNDAQARIFGISSAEEFKRNLVHFAENFETFTSDGRISGLAEWPISRVLKGQSVPATEFRVRHRKTGREWYCTFSGEPVYDNAGNLYLAVMITRDITAVKRAEMALKESEESFRTLANSIPQLAWMTDETGSVVWYNQRWYDYTGRTFEEMKGQRWMSIHHPAHVERVVAHFQRQVEAGQGWEDTFPLRSKTGEWRWFLSRANPVRDQSGKILRWIGSNTDITEQRNFAEQLKAAQSELQRAVQEAQRANQAKSMFLANTSHEIRTPMSAILGFSELLTDSGLSESDRVEYLDRVRSNGHQLLHLIDDILDLSKFEAGKTPVDKIKFSTVELIQDLVQSFRPMAEAKRISMSVDFLGLVPQVICSDPLRLRQILTNIIGNAVKFSEGGAIKLHLGFESLEERIDGLFVVDIEDDGIGISVEDQRKLFQPFSQADGSIVRRFGGTGLGLTLSQRLARVLGGDVVLKSSAPGRGSCFRITVSTGDVSGVRFVNDLRKQLKSDELPIRDQAERRLARSRILLAEDSPDNEALLRIYLRNEGAEVDVAHNGLEAIQMARVRPYDILLMDIQMPVLDGLEATRRLRASGYQTPIIALTAHALREEVDRSMAAGCNYHLSKPVNRTDLVDTITDQISEARKRKWHF